MPSRCSKLSTAVAGRKILHWEGESSNQNLEIEEHVSSRLGTIGLEFGAQLSVHEVVYRYSCISSQIHVCVSVSTRPVQTGQDYMKEIPSR